MNDASQNVEIVELPLDEVEPDPNQPRKQFAPAELAELQANLDAHEQIYPVVVFKAGNKFRVFDGERRLRCAVALGWQTIRAIVRDRRPEPGEVMLLQLVVNCQRTGLNAMELSDGYAETMKQTAMNATQLARALTKSKSHVSDMLSLQRLPETVKDSVRDGTLGVAKAAALARLPEREQTEASEKLVAGELTREQLQQQATGPQNNKGKGYKRFTLELPGVTTSVASKSKLKLDDIISTFQQLVTECKRARSKGLDVSTLVGVLRDQARQQMSKEDEHADVA